MRIVLRYRDQRVSTGYTTAFDPKDGSVMVLLSPTSPAGSIVSLDIIEVLALEPTDGKPLTQRSAQEPSPGVRVVFADGRQPSDRSSVLSHLPSSLKLIGADGSIEKHGIWMRPPDDRFDTERRSALRRAPRRGSRRDLGKDVDLSQRFDADGRGRDTDGPDRRHRGRHSG